MKKIILLKTIAFYTIFFAIQYFIFSSDAISGDLDDIETFSPLSEQNIAVLAQEENTTSFIQADGQLEPGYRCGTVPPTMEQTEAVQRAIDELFRSRGFSLEAIPCTVTIPVAFHILRYDNGVTGNVTNQQIYDQIDVLNDSYASTPFQFELDSIERVNNTTWSLLNTAAAEMAAKQALSISPATTLNIYTCTNCAGYLGWAYFPWSYPEGHYIHGVVARYSSFPGGSAYPYDEGDTVTHEVGHYLGLFHTFQGGCISPGDYVDDTPYEASPAFGCLTGRDTCPQPGVDPIHNFMDYSDDACMDHFTADQSVRTDAQVELYKPSLISCGSAGIKYTPVTPCKIVDTRNTSGGMISPTTARNFHVFGGSGTISGQGGNLAGCPSPGGNPLAAHINVVAVDPTGKGNLKAFPVGAGSNAGLSVNFNTIDTNLANAGTVKTAVGAGPDITVATQFQSAHTSIQVLGYYYPDGDLLYAPVTPCKIVDTRNTSGGMINPTTARDFHVFGNPGTISGQGGNLAGCPSPGGNPLAAHINMVAVDPTGKGNLKAFPVGAGSNAGLSVNFNTIDTNLANAGTVKTAVGAGPDITVATQFQSAHTSIQVLGYYYPDGDLLYAPVAPCKIVDTRNTSRGMINPTTARDFHVFGNPGTISGQGGNPAGCPSPGGNPLAAHINVVAVDPTGKGNLKAFPVGAGSNAGLSVNFNTIDTNLANAGTVKTAVGAGPDITVATQFQSAHTSIMVLGYYYAAP